MATGYTNPVKEGKVTFAQFVWVCARAFGALIEIRDDGLDAPIPESFQPSKYYKESVDRAEAALRALEEMTETDIERAAVAEREAAADSAARIAAERQVSERRYLEMLSRVEAWEPPTTEHAGLKEFMIAQLTESIEWDCKPWRFESAPPKTVAQWRADEFERRRAALARARESLADELKRIKSRNDWLAALRKSVPYERAP